MPSREYHEALWENVPARVEPPLFVERSSFVLAHVNAGERVLDLGCGEARFAAALADAGARVLAVDVAEEPLRRAREAYPLLELGLIEGEADWPLADAEFDVVWAGEVIEHVADTSRWLSEVRRVLRPHGTLLLSTPAHGTFELARVALSRRARERCLDPRGEHLRFYTRASLISLLGDFRFEQIELHAIGSRLRDQRTLLAAARRSRF